MEPAIQIPQMLSKYPCDIRLLCWVTSEEQLPVPSKTCAAEGDCSWTARAKEPAHRLFEAPGPLSICHNDHQATEMMVHSVM